MSRELFAALRAGKVGPVREALAAGADPNARDRHGFPALAASFGATGTACAVALLDAGADVNAPDADGLRPLDHAMICGGPAAAYLLLDRGAEVNYTRPCGTTPLMAAAGYGDVKLVGQLLAAGADPDAARAEDGLTAADLQVIAVHSPDAPPGMKRSSRRILDALAAAGAKVRRYEDLVALADARYQRRAAAEADDEDEEDAEPAPPDPALDAVRGFAAAARSAAFRAVLDHLAALCKSPPKPFRPTDREMHEECDGVYLCRFDRAKLLAHFRRAKATTDELLSALAEQVLARGFTLVQNTDVKGAAVRLLLPTADPLAVVYAHAVNTNGGPDLDDLVGGLRRVYALAPFVVTDCGHDTVAAAYRDPPPPDRADAANDILNALCPPEDDFDEFDEFDDEPDGDESADDEDEDDGPGGFFLWWD